MEQQTQPIAFLFEEVAIYKPEYIENLIDGLTEEHVNKWKWNVNENNWINFPDYQWRIYKNDSKIVWINKVHECLSGFNTYANLPPALEYCLLHHKTIEKQEKQNNYYDTL